MENEKKTTTHPTIELFKLRRRVASLEAQVECLTKSVPAVTYRCEIEGQSFIPIFVSPNFKRQFGYEEEECLENPFWWPNNIHPEDQRRVFHQLSRLYRNGKHSHEYRFRQKNGIYLWILDNLHLLTDEEGSPVGIVGSWLDITERKQEREQAGKQRRSEQY